MTLIYDAILFSNMIQASVSFLYSSCIASTYRADAEPKNSLSRYLTVQKT